MAQDVTNDVTDRDQLSRMALAAKEILGVDKVKAVADMGYAHGQELKACLEAGIEPSVHLSLQYPAGAHIPTIPCLRQ